ncbi:glycosyltransferase family 2 protein [Nocardiopsis sp. CNT-189]
MTAVIVTHDGARWLPEALQAVREQTRPVQRVVGVDAGSRDGSGDILASFLAPEVITAVPRDTGFGDSVRAGLALARERGPFPGAAPEATEWIWLVHDDLVPDPGALQTLLEAANDDRRAAVLGPKLRDFYDRRMLVEAGVTIDGAGRRETGLEPREFDHGQHDGDRQVLAVSSAGMLIRRDVWDEIGGFDATLPLFRDDIDFCWRAGAAGHRVLLVTGAVAYHAEASARRRRKIAAAGGHPRRLDRHNALFVLLANLPFGGMLGALLRNAFGSLLRVLMYLVAKQPASAFDEAAAITAVFFRPGRLIKGRFRRRRNRRRTYSAIRPFLAHGVALRQFTTAVAGLLSGDASASDTPGRHQAVTTAPRAEDDEDPLRDDQSVLRRVLAKPGVLLVLGLTAVALVAERSLLSGGTLAGGALPPAVGGASDLWHLYLSGAQTTGVGSDAPAPPYVALLALVSTIALGKPWLAVNVILLGCVPLAGLTAYLLARRVLHFLPAQLWMACSYALLPMATGAVAQGRVGTALVHALLPVLGILGTRVLTLPPKRSRRAAWGTAVLLAACTAFVPLLWLLALVVAVLLAVAYGHLGRRLYISVAIAVGVPPLLLLPWSIELVLHPSLWLLEAGLHAPELSAPAPAAHELLMLSPGGPGVPVPWVTAGFIAASLSALLLLRRRMLVAVGWSITLFGILIAILTSRIVVEPGYGGPAAPAWPGVALAFAATAMLLTAAASAQSFGLMWRLGGARRLFAGGAAALALTTPVSAAGLWMWQGVDGPLSGDAPSPVPGFVSAIATDPAAGRTLVLRPVEDGPLRYAVLRGGEPRLGTEQIPADQAAGTELDTAVAALAAGRAGDEAEDLAGYGIGHVMIPRPQIGGDADETLVDTLDGTPGLSRQMLSEEFALWRLDTPAGRLRVVPSGGDGEEDDGRAEALDIGPGEGSAEVPPGPADRSLVLAEPYAAGWSATLDGEPLRASEAYTGMTLFELPPEGGTVVIARGSAGRDAWLVLQGLLIATALVLASPGARTEEDDHADEIRARARPRRPRRRAPDPVPARPSAEERPERALSPDGPGAPGAAAAPAPEEPPSPESAPEPPPPAEGADEGEAPPEPGAAREGRGRRGVRGRRRASHRKGRHG